MSLLLSSHHLPPRSSRGHWASETLHIAFPHWSFTSLFSCFPPTVFDILSTYFETHSWPEALKKGVSPGKGYILRDPVDDGQRKIPDVVGEAPKVS